MAFCRAVVVVVLMSATSAWAVNKCAGPDGKVSYQDAPCEAKSSANRDDLADARKRAKSDPEAKALQEWLQREKAQYNGKPASTDTGSAMSQEDRQRHERARICNGSYKQEPVVGMTEAVALNCLRIGEPTLLQETETVSGISRTYAYSRAANGLQLHLIVRNGVVVLVQR